MMKYRRGNLFLTVIVFLLLTMSIRRNGSLIMSVPNSPSPVIRLHRQRNSSR